MQTRGFCLGTLALPGEEAPAPFVPEREHPLAQQLLRLAAACAPGTLSWKRSCLIRLKTLSGLVAFREEGLSPVLLRSRMAPGFISSRRDPRSCFRSAALRLAPSRAAPSHLGLALVSTTERKVTSIRVAGYWHPRRRMCGPAALGRSQGQSGPLGKA